MAAAAMNTDVEAVDFDSDDDDLMDEEGAMRSVLDRSDREYVRLHQPHCANASAFGLRGYVDNTLPSCCYASP